MRYLFSALVVFTMLFSFTLQGSAAGIRLLGIAQEANDPNDDGQIPEIEFNMDEEEEFPQAMLYEIDPATGAVTPIGKTGFFGCAGLDFEPATDRAFAVCLRLPEDEDNGPPVGEEVSPEARMEEDDNGQLLVEIDIATGQGTLIGSLGIQSELIVTDISFRSDGTLFAIVNGLSGVLIGGGGGNQGLNRLIDPEEEDEVLATIDTLTGKASLVGLTGTGRSFDAIGFSAMDQLYHTTDRLVNTGDVNMLNAAIGSAIKLAALNIPPEAPELVAISTLDAHPGTGELFGMLVEFITPDFRPPGDLELEGRVEFMSGSNLIKLNAQTGDIEVIGLSTGPFNQMGAIAFLGREELEVPTMSEWGLIITGVLLLGAAAIYLRRRQLQQ